MELLGHSQMRTTMDIYSHVMPALARKAIRMAPCGWQVRGDKLQPRKPSTQGATKKALLTRVELRGLEPLTPTLPGRLGAIRRGTPLFICPGQKAAGSSADRYGQL
jgi:hypothetical protein